MLLLDKSINKKCNSAVIITGAARSGTTILGKIIHSFKNVEYAFEPPLLVSLFPLINKLNEERWKFIYETYLFEELLINSLAGRYINCNKMDDSSIYNVKSKEEINKRLSRSISKTEAENLAKNATIAFKIPSIIPFIPRLKEYYPDTRIIVIKRNAVDVFNSIKRKGWFKTKNLNNKNEIWPYRIYKGIKVPYWVDIKDNSDWVEMDELHRIAYYYIKMNKDLKLIKDCFIIKYGELVNNTTNTINNLAKQLGLYWGEKTDEIISSVKYQPKNRDKKILNKLDSEIKEEVIYYSKMDLCI